MKMTSKKLKKRIKELKGKLHPIKEEKLKLKASLQQKKEELNQIKTHFYSKYPEEDITKEDNQQMLDKNNKLLIEIFNLYKENNDKTKKKIIIEYTIDSIKEKSQNEYKKLLEKVNFDNGSIKELSEKIQKAQKDIDKYIKSSELEFDIQNYIINPSLEYTYQVAESQLMKQVLKRLEKLLKYSKKETAEVREEYAERKTELDEIKEKHHVHNNSKSNDDTKMTSKEVLKKNDKGQNEDDKERQYEDDENDNNEEYDENISIEVDTSILTKEHIERFIESPHFIDKVVTRQSVVIKPLKLLLDIESPHEKATILKIRHIEKEKESLEKIHQELDEILQSIKFLQSEYDALLKQNKKLIKKHNKLKDNITFVSNKVEILSDQIELIDEQMKVSEDDNKVSDNIKELLKKSHISINSNFAHKQ